MKNYNCDDNNQKPPRAWVYIGPPGVTIMKSMHVDGGGIQWEQGKNVGVDQAIKGRVHVLAARRLPIIDFRGRS